ncbi:MAG: T9SS type A sorting domain-containing protein [Spirosomataceae bacterium]
MKKLLSCCAFFVGLYAQAQDIWNKKADLPGPVRFDAISFVIDSKAYVGTGSNNSGVFKDFWEYDPVINRWTQKANVGNVGRRAAGAFAVNGKGYVVGGSSSGGRKDVWEYNPTTDVWLQKMDFPETVVYMNSFTIGTKGYIFVQPNKLYEYDPTQDTWTRKRDLPVSRGSVASVSIGGKGYIGLGNGYFDTNFYQDWWEYDPSSDNWTQKKSFPGTSRNGATTFERNNLGYVGLGLTGTSSNSTSYNDFWAYNPAVDDWTQVVGGAYAGRYSATGFAVGNYGYFFGGQSGSYGPQYRIYNQLWALGPCDPVGDPNVFGTNQWNVYAWNGGGGTTTFTNDAWIAGYVGYYTDTALNIDTRNQWDQNLSPSFASTYQGCTLGSNDSFSWSAKRKGFPCGKYRINIPANDDAAQLFINDVKVWDSQENTARNGVWQGYLDANSKVEFRGIEGGGAALGVVEFEVVKPVISLSGGLPVCTGQSITLSASADVENNFSWSTNETTSSITVSQPGTFTVKSTDQCGNAIESAPTPIYYMAKPSTNPVGDIALNDCAALLGGGVSFGVIINGFPINFVSEVNWYRVGEPTPIQSSPMFYVQTSTPGQYYAIVKANGCTSPPSDNINFTIPTILKPEVFGDNAWNVYAFEDANQDFSGPYYVYRGYYTEPNLSFDTRDRWAAENTPSDASGYRGCNTYYDYFKLSAKRRGFPCGRYSIDVPGHDDYVELYIDGQKVWEFNSACCRSHTGVWEGELGPTTEIEYVLLENEGNALAAIQFNLLNTNSRPVPSAGVIQATVCLGQRIELTSSGGAQYTWSGPSGFSSLEQNPSSLVATSVAQSGTYTVAVSTPLCPVGATATVAVLVKSPTIPSIQTNSPVCLGGALNLSTSAGNAYTWAGPNSYRSAQQNPILTNTNTSMIGTYSVTVFDGVCTASATTSVQVSAQITPQASSNAPLCISTTLSLSVNISAAAYTWTGPNFTSSQQNPQRSNISTAMAGTYSVTVSTNSGCVGTAQISVQVKVSLIPQVSSNSPICPGKSLQLSANSGLIYSWKAPDGFSSAEQNPTRPSASTLMGGVYSLTVTNTNGCTASNTLSASVQPASLNISPNPLTVCLGQTINLTANASPAASAFLWKGPASFSSNTQHISTYATTTANLGIYSVSATIGSCTVSTTTEVKAGALLQAGVVGLPCVGGTIQLTASGMSSYSWSRTANNFTSNLPNPVIPSSTMNDAGIYFLTARSGSCVASTLVLVMLTGMGINPTFSVSPTSFAAGATVALSATSATGSYSWSGPSGFSGNTRTKTLNNFQAVNNGVYRLTLTSGACSGYSEKTIAINSATRLAAAESSEEESIDLAINAYPNPVTHTLTVEVQLKEPSSLQLNLVNSVGRNSGSWQLQEVSIFHQTELNLADLQGGVYLLQAQAGKQKVVKRIVKIQY